MRAESRTELRWALRTSETPNWPTWPKVIALAFLLTGSMTALGNEWSRQTKPLPSPPQVFGFYTAGCIAGAESLPPHGPGFQVMRPNRNRYHGHPRLTAFIRTLGHQADAWGNRILIGDLSQPLGGPMSYGHRSHQIGLDADIWFRLIDNDRLLSRRETEEDPMRPVVRAVAGRLDDSRWSPRFRDLLKIAAASPEVKRIFVNPVIKQALCRQERDRGWLRKIRPWWGHDAHFHVRLRCPSDSPDCRSQKPPPPGDGCDASLDRWVKDIQLAALSPPPSRNRVARRKPVALPARCDSVLRP